MTHKLSPLVILLTIALVYLKSFTTVASAASATLVRTIDTSKSSWNPSSPDPAGIAYRPQTNGLLITDSEVEENHPDFLGFNVFESTLSGAQTTPCSTTTYTVEPTGVTVNPENGHLFISDDDANRIFEVNLVDDIYCNGNDTVTSLNTNNFGSTDSEGVAYGDHHLFIAGGINSAVFIYNLGLNDTIGGGDDQFVRQTSTLAYGISDIEGIEFHPTRHTIFTSSASKSERLILETDVLGNLITAYDISSLGSIHHSGLAFAPGSNDPGSLHLYLVDRGLNNNADPLENDGQIFELSLNYTNLITPSPANSPTPHPTTTPIPPSPTPLPGDTDADDDVDIYDYSNLISYFGTVYASNCPADHPLYLGDVYPHPTGDCVVNILDYSLVISNFGS